MLTQTRTKIDDAGIEITASIMPDAGMWQVVVIHRFESGNFYKKVHDKVTYLMAQTLQNFYVGA